MLESLAELEIYVAATPSRHQFVNHQTCGCGWESRYDRTWDDHYHWAWREDVSEALRNHTSLDDYKTRVSCSDADDEIRRVIDGKNDQIFELLNALRKIGRGEVEGPVEHFAFNTAHTFSWPDDSAGLITGYLPDARHYDNEGNLVKPDLSVGG